ncbi:hypothetical protein ACLOAV_009914 [Pseudogymnoascus australis]
MSSVGNELHRGYEGNNKAVIIVLGSFIVISWYNCIELLVLIFITFNHYSGLYFWSLLVSTVFGVLPHSVGYLIKDFDLTVATWLPVTLVTIGWWVMVPGQSIVLYSRLNLVLYNQRILRLVLYMIIANIILLMVPTTILTYGSSLSNSKRYDKPYIVFDRIQIIGFSIQEIIISGLYMKETRRMLKLNPKGKSHKIIIQLFVINFLFIIIDLGLIALQFANLFLYETTFKGLVYSIKLKLEFAVLGNLVKIANPQNRNPDSNLGIPSKGRSKTADFANSSQLTSDVTHAAGPVMRNYRLPPHMRPEDVSIAMFEHSNCNHDMIDESLSPEVAVDEISSSGPGTQPPVYSASNTENNSEYKSPESLRSVDYE